MHSMLILIMTLLCNPAHSFTPLMKIDYGAPYDPRNRPHAPKHTLATTLPHSPPHTFHKQSCSPVAQSIVLLKLVLEHHEGHAAEAHPDPTHTHTPPPPRKSYFSSGYDPKQFK